MSWWWALYVIGVVSAATKSFLKNFYTIIGSNFERHFDNNLFFLNSGKHYTAKTSFVEVTKFLACYWSIWYVNQIRFCLTLQKLLNYCSYLHKICQIWRLGPGKYFNVTYLTFELRLQGQIKNLLAFYSWKF